MKMHLEMRILHAWTFVLLERLRTREECAEPGPKGERGCKQVFGQSGSYASFYAPQISHPAAGEDAGRYSRAGSGELLSKMFGVDEIRKGNNSTTMIRSGLIYPDHLLHSLSCILLWQF